MILQLFITLLLISVTSMLVTQRRRKRIWSVLVLAVLCIVAYFFMQSISTNTQEGFIYQWLPYSNLKADIMISSAVQIKQVLIPTIFITSFLLYFNIISSAEQHALNFNNLLLLNLVGFILLISGNDFFQIMFASCMLSVIGFYMPDFILPKKKLFIFNFLSEMAIFTALAIIYGKIGSISLTALPQFVKNGHHKDLVAGLLMFAIGCKCGLFLLNGQFHDLKYALFNRMISIMSISTPLSGIILFIKFKPVLLTNTLFEDVFPVWLTISVITSLFSALINNNIRSKAISFALCLYSVSLMMIYNDSSVLYHIITILIPSLIITMTIILIVSVLSSDEKDVSYLDSFLGKYNFVLTLILFTAAISLLTSKATTLYIDISTNIYLFVLAIIIKMLYFKIFRKQKTLLTPIQSISFLYWFPLLLLSLFLIWQSFIWPNPRFISMMIICMVTVLLIPARLFIRFGQAKIWQFDILSYIYETFLLKPLRYIGRFLWLAFDVMVIERRIIATISHTTKVIISGVHKLQETGRWSCLISIAIGVSIMLIYWGVYINE